MASYSIKDLEKISGIKAHTIRIWEKRYALIQPERSLTNIRYYNDNDLRKILNVSILIRNGFKISKISELNDVNIGEKVLIFSQKKSDVAGIIEHLMVAMFELDEHKFEHIISNQILNKGFEETIIKVIYPFFDRLGILWQAGSVMPAQEHFVSNIIRQMFIVAIDGLHTTETIDKKFLLFLPEGEYHELGLLFYSYILKKRGFKVIYLGQSVPLENLKLINNVLNIDYILFTVNTALNHQKLEDLKTFLFLNFECKIFVSGLQSNSFNSNEFTQLVQMKSPEHFLNLITEFCV